MVIDLHTHSSVSDGTDPPARVVELAVEARCSAVALTDHDSLAGLAAATTRADQLGIRLVPGCEVSCLPFAGGGVHVLVYFVDDDSSPLGEELTALRTDRRRRNVALVARLAELGIAITYEQVVSHAGSDEVVGRPHVAAALVEVGAASSFDDAFDRYLGNGRAAFIPKARLSATDVARLARASGGVAVLAHPLSTGLSGRALARAVGELAEGGFGGLEARYGAYAPRTRRELGALAAQLGLVATGGSDYHGAIKPDLAVGTGRGDLKVPNRTLAELEARRPG